VETCNKTQGSETIYLGWKKKKHLTASDTLDKKKKHLTADFVKGKKNRLKLNKKRSKTIGIGQANKFQKRTMVINFTDFEI